jgi:hypothetical protein
MGRDAESAEAPHILDDVARLAGQRKGRGGHVDRDVVAAARADLDAVQAQHAGAVLRRIRLPGGVAVVGEDEKPESRAAGRGRDFVGPLNPSDRFVWTWMMPGIVPSVGGGNGSGRGGIVTPT